MDGMDTAPKNKSDDDVVAKGVKSILKLALEQEVKDVIQRCAEIKDEQGRRLVVRNGKGRKRKIVYSNGAFEITAPRINDRRRGERFKSKILPSYSRKPTNIDEAVSALHSKGINVNAFDDALQKLLEDNTAWLAQDTISDMKKSWLEEMQT